jgi:hypothetical protein
MAEHPAVKLQLPQATVVEKLGEFREPFSVERQNGNPERSLPKRPVDSDTV